MGRSRRTIPKRLPEKLYYIRRHLNLTQEQMVERLKARIRAPFYDVPPLYPGHISGYERGEREPPLVVLLHYARLANVPLENLVDDALRLPSIYLIYKAEKERRDEKKRNRLQKTD